MADFIFIIGGLAVFVFLIAQLLRWNDRYVKKQVDKLSDSEKAIYTKKEEVSKAKNITFVKSFCSLMALAFISGFFGAKNFFVMDVSYANHNVWFLLLSFALVICGLKYERFLKWKSTKKWY